MSRSAGISWRVTIAPAVMLLALSACAKQDQGMADQLAAAEAAADKAVAAQKAAEKAAADANAARNATAPVAETDSSSIDGLAIDDGSQHGDDLAMGGENQVATPDYIKHDQVN